MKKTKKMIALVGNQKYITKALDVLKDFKAVTLLRELSKELVEGVYQHNKSVIYPTKAYGSAIKSYNPITIKIVKGKSNFAKMELGTKNIKEDFAIMMENINVDVGDHLSDDSSNARRKKYKAECKLCRIVHGNPEHPEHILYESKNFIVVPGLGAFFKGYVMICPKRHIMSFAECTKEEFEEFLEVLNDMKHILSEIYSSEIFCFECGSGKNGAGKITSSITHAHFHMAPTDMEVLKSVHNSGIYPALIDKYKLKNYGVYPYLLYVDQQDNWYITSDPDSYYPRQHSRQMLAEYYGLEKGQYNWRTNPLYENMDVIAEEIYSYYRENFENLPAWIQERVKDFI